MEIRAKCTTQHSPADPHTEILRQQEDDLPRTTLGLPQSVVPAPSTPALVTNSAASSDRPPEDSPRSISDPVTFVLMLAASRKPSCHPLTCWFCATCDEKLTPPQRWRTLCGWRYGCARFFRVATVSDAERVCKKCFDSQETQEPSVADHSDNESSSSESGSSSAIFSMRKEKCCAVFSLFQFV